MKTRKELSPHHCLKIIGASLDAIERENARLETALAREVQKIMNLRAFVASKQRVVSVRDLLAILTKPDESKILSPIEELKLIISDETGISYKALNIRSRHGRSVWARQIGMVIALKLELGPQEYIEKKFGCTTHGTIHHARCVVETETQHSGERKNQFLRCLARGRQMMAEREEAAVTAAGGA